MRIEEWWAYHFSILLLLEVLELPQVGALGVLALRLPLQVDPLLLRHQLQENKITEITNICKI